MRSTINGANFSHATTTLYFTVFGVFYRVLKPYTEHAVDPKEQESGIDPVLTLPHNPTTSASLIGEAYSTETTGRDDVNPHR